MWVHSKKEWFNWSKSGRIRFARASISRAKMDLKRLIKYEPRVEELFNRLESVQIDFRNIFAKVK